VIAASTSHARFQVVLNTTICITLLICIPIALSCLCNLCSLLWVDLLSVLVVSDSWWRCSVPSSFPRSNTNDLSVNGAGDTVLELQVHLGNGVVGEDRGVRNITNRSGLDHVANCESLDCLVLWSTSRAIGASNGLDVTSAFLIASIGRSLLDHDRGDGR